MQCISLTHLSDQILLRDLAMHATNDRRTTAMLLAHVAEVMRRRLYRGQGYASMRRYLVYELLMSSDVAEKRIQAATAARMVPGILPAIEDGRLNLTGVVLLAPHLTRGNASELLTAATGKTNRAIKQLIAERFPQADLPTFVQPIAPRLVDAPAIAPARLQLESAAPVELEPDSNPVVPSESSVSPNSTGPLPADAMPAYAKVAPLAPQRFGVQFTMDQATHALLCEVQNLLGPSVPSSDIAKVFALALDCFKAKLLKQKAGKCDHPRARRGSEDARYVPDEVKRAVWARDSGRCTFVGTSGKRCDARDGVQYDHVQPVALGGESTVANVRLLCHAHNQFEAERVLGSKFMSNKRDAAKARSRSAASPGSSQDLVPRLRELGLTETQAAEAAARCANYSRMPFEERLALALQSAVPATERLNAALAGAVSR